MLFKNKVVIVTGASSGIGAATAIALIAEGAKVSMVARNETKLANVAKICEEKGGKPLVIVADVTKDEDAKRIINETLKKYGSLDVLVNNAGINKPTSILAPEAMENFDRIMTTNLRSAVHLSHLAAPHLIKTKGNIVNISSACSLGVLYEKGFPYMTSKAGMDHFSRAIAVELAKYGVRVNNVNPGPVKSDIRQNAGLTKEQDDAIMNERARLLPLQRVGESEEIADLILFVASDKARSITGATLVSDNGAVMAGLAV